MGQGAMIEENAPQEAAALELVVRPALALARLETLADQAREYAAAARASSTERAYRTDWRAWMDWCLEHGVEPLPATPASLALYLTDQADRLRVSSLQRRLSGIVRGHRGAGHPSPLDDPRVRDIWRGIRRSKGTAQVGKAALLTADVRGMVAALPETIAGLRDRALLLLGFAGAFRRSELVALDVEDLRRTSEGLVVLIRRSKTDQEGTGQQLGIPLGRHADTCPVRAVETWLDAAGIEGGPIFRAVDRHLRIGDGCLSDRAVALIVKRAAVAAGLDPAAYAGHSLRAGLATSAAMAGVEERQIMTQTRHRSVTVARKYIREGSLFRGNAAAAVGL